MNILICDGVKSDTEKLKCILDYSYGSAVKTTVFHRTSDALSYLSSGAAVDVCFLETVTPEMNGIEFAEAMRAKGYAGEIVFLSGRNGFASETYHVKALGFLLKPPVPEQVRDVLGRLDTKLKRSCPGE